MQLSLLSRGVLLGRCHNQLSPSIATSQVGCQSLEVGVSILGFKVFLRELVHELVLVLNRQSNDNRITAYTNTNNNIISIIIIITINDVNNDDDSNNSKNNDILPRTIDGLI